VGGAEQHRHSAEFTLASHVVVASQITQTSMQPTAVEFRHRTPTNIAEHTRIFGVAPSFGHPANALVWQREVLERAVPAADPALSRVVERHARALLAALPDVTRGYADRVRGVLARALESGDASLGHVARELKLSERSLQRRLAAEQQSFDGLLDEVRHTLALRYLADPRLGISELAYLLGYSEASAFHRAFRRWTGSTPAQLRKGGVAAESGSTS
ncbi:MAG: helix-turn-helix domain-containing protein, partial [Polyangiales bacterium]